MKKIWHYSCLMMLLSAMFITDCGGADASSSGAPAKAVQQEKTAPAPNISENVGKADERTMPEKCRQQQIIPWAVEKDVGPVCHIQVNTEEAFQEIQHLPVHIELSSADELKVGIVLLGTVAFRAGARRLVGIGILSAASRLTAIRSLPVGIFLCRCFEDRYFHQGTLLKVQELYIPGYSKMFFGNNRDMPLTGSSESGFAKGRYMQIRGLRLQDIRPQKQALYVKERLW